MKRIESALVVEDNANARLWLEECLVAAFPGVVVSAARTLQEGRRAVAGNGGFDMALVDIGLPDGSGIDLVADIVARGDGCFVIVTTIYDDDEHLFEAIRAGAAGYILKHHETERLISLLRRIHDGEPPLSPAIARRMMGALQVREAVPAKLEEAVLTARESEVLALLGRGFQLAHVAATLSISQNTAASHVKSIYRKLNISSRAEAALAAAGLGLVRRS